MKSIEPVADKGRKERSMFDQNFFRHIEGLVQNELSCAAHDLSHVWRVYKTACMIAEEEGADQAIVKTATLLHDIARVKEDCDPTGTIDHALLGAEMAAEILTTMGCEAPFVLAVKNAIARHRFRGNNHPQTLEDKILFDADKLDALGAVGIARAFMIAGEYGEPLYRETNLEDYIRTNISNGTPTGKVLDLKQHAPNLEYEIKLKAIPARLFTETGKRIAAERMALMQDYFDLLGQDCA